MHTRATAAFLKLGGLEEGEPLVTECLNRAISLEISNHPSCSSPHRFSPMSSKLPLHPCLHRPLLLSLLGFQTLPIQLTLHQASCPTHPTFHRPASWTTVRMPSSSARHAPGHRFPAPRCARATPLCLALLKHPPCQMLQPWSRALWIGKQGSTTT